MSALAWSIILMATVAASALIVAVASDGASAAQPRKPFRAPTHAWPRPRAILRCLPKIIAKCPHGQRPACVAFSGKCCARLGCKPSAK